jgi:hypothetical protein
LRPAIALKELLRSLTEMDAAALELVGLAVEDDVGVVVDGALVLLLGLLLQAAIRRAAAVAAATVTPALAVTEYTDVPRFILARHAVACTRPNCYGPAIISRVLFAESVGLEGETLPLTLP